MNTIEFQKRLKSYQVFSLQDIRKSMPGFSYRQLDRWEKKGYLRKIKRGFYMLADLELSERFLFFTANKIYSPSYISLEKALKFYGLIPDEIFQITSVSSKKTTSFETAVGNFSYRRIKPSLFWGYKMLKFGEHKILMADMEKAILDYLYLHPELKTADDFSAMRVNIDSFHEQIDLVKYQKYLEAFENKALSKRSKVFINSLKND